MEENQGANTVSEAKLIVLSVICTVLVVAAVTYVFRVSIIDYILSSVEPDIQKMIPAPQIFVSDEERVIAAIATVNPAVVSVVVTKDVPIYEQYYETINPWGVFGGFTVPRVRENGTEEREVGGGSGFIVSSDGLIVTNRHVVDDPEARYSVVLSNGSVYDVTVVDRDPQLDIAILELAELPNEQLAFVSFGDSESLVLGQTVIAIGNALAEFQNTVSLGIVSGLGRSIVASDTLGNTERLNQVIQTDAAINPGNSGGPLLNLDGEVIGVNVATSEGADNIGFALPSQIVREVVDSVREYGEILRPFLGVRYVMIDESTAAEYALTEPFGAFIIPYTEETLSIEPGSPAEQAGLLAGDIITAVDEVELRNRDLATELRNKSVGETVELVIVREGTEFIVEVALAEAL